MTGTKLWILAAGLAGGSSISLVAQETTLVTPENTLVPIGLAAALGASAVIAAYKAGTATKGYSQRLSTVETQLEKLTGMVQNLQEHLINNNNHVE